MVLMDLTKAPNVKGYGKKVADEMLFFFSWPSFLFKYFVCVSFIIYILSCLVFKRGGRKGDQENSEFYENRLRG